MQSIEQIDLIQTIEEIFMNTCIAYFSKSGNTKIAAEYLAEKIGAKVIALSDGTNYKGLIGFMKGGMNASLTRKAKLDSATFDEIAKYERIVLATPVWAGKTTPAINAVLENVDFADKQVYVMTMQADPDCKDAGKRGEFYKEAIGAKKGQFMALFAMHGNAPGKLTARELIIKRVDETVKLEAAS
jgi:flavodoxin